MTKTYYECHVTMTGDRNLAEHAVANLLGTWRFSSIDGDANFGNGVKHYATIQLNTKIGLEAAVAQVLDAGKFLRFKGLEVIREKVEEVLFDTRSSKVQACTDCAACQEAR